MKLTEIRIYAIIVIYAIITAILGFDVKHHPLQYIVTVILITLWLKSIQYRQAKNEQKQKENSYMRNDKS
jgi:hypothetical protein